jgi:hypothetical protein
VKYEAITGAAQTSKMSSMRQRPATAAALLARSGEGKPWTVKPRG